MCTSMYIYVCMWYIYIYVSMWYIYIYNTHIFICVVYIHIHHARIYVSSSTFLMGKDTLKHRPEAWGSASLPIL